MSLQALFSALAEAFDAPNIIERAAAAALRDASRQQVRVVASTPLPQPILDVIRAPDAHPVCALIAQTPLDWAPPHTSSDPTYRAHSVAKRHVELVGPEGLVASDMVRIGLYGILPHSEYGIRTHPAEEVFVMLAGEAFWKRADGPYVLTVAAGRAHHPSMMPHATKTGTKAFMSVYAWHGNISTDDYIYAGLPAD